MSHLLQWSKDEEDDNEKPAILHSFLKKINQVTVCLICNHSE